MRNSWVNHTLLQDVRIGHRPHHVDAVIGSTISNATKKLLCEEWIVEACVVAFKTTVKVINLQCLQPPGLCTPKNVLPDLG